MVIHNSPYQRFAHLSSFIFHHSSMKIVQLNDFLDNKEFYITEAKAGKIFVYPTDTIYGIGWIYNEENIKKVFEIKHRDDKKIFSIIAPSFDRIKENYASETSKLHEVHYDKLPEYLDTYHGVTYIFDYARPGVRIIKHPFQQFVEKLWMPFITTSCNISWEPVIIDINNIPEDIASKVDYIVDGGIGWGKPSVLIDFVGDKIIER